MLDIVRDSTVGQIINRLSHGKLLAYEDQKPGFVIPERYLASSNASNQQREPLPRTQTGNETLVNAPGTVEAASPKEPTDLEKASPTENAAPQVEEKPLYPYLVDWEENDQDNPKCVSSLAADSPNMADRINRRNWSRNKRVFVAGLISLLTFSVYIGSAIYTSAIPSLMAEFNISLTVATLGLTLFVLAYGIGPMILAPFQDMPSIGRNPIYIGGLFLFVLFQAPIVAAPNFATILVFRFLTGFFGSPALATGGASMGGES